MYLLREEDFLARVVLKFATAANKTEVLSPLEYEMNDGKLGALQVDPHLVVFEKLGKIK